MQHFLVDATSNPEHYSLLTSENERLRDPQLVSTLVVTLIPIALFLAITVFLLLKKKSLKPLIVMASLLPLMIIIFDVTAFVISEKRSCRKLDGIVHGNDYAIVRVCESSLQGMDYRPMDDDEYNRLAGG